ncbi:CIC11C00000000104 [Sungouiella intermedia]|uniref:CIC11C00000000104 n=1 Tax=Sungouiella intermedia TaxID=45354 RepID=A0A1L0C171_9ASCO|nr:CIC11C00000000104 [[Candida] intermedia]
MFSHCLRPAYAPLLSVSSMEMGHLPASKGRRRQTKALLKSFFHRKVSGCRYELPAFCGTSDTSSSHRRVRDRIRTAFQSWFTPKKCHLNSLNQSTAGRLLDTANYSTAQGDYSPCSLSSIATGCETDAGTWNQVRFCTQPTYASAPHYDECSSSFVLSANYSSYANDVLSVRIRVKDISISKLESIAETNESDKYDESDKYNESDETCVESIDSLSLPDSAGLSYCEPRYHTANLHLNNSSSSSHFAGSFQESLPLKKIRKSPTPSLINVSKSASDDSINPSYPAAMVSGSTPVIDPELPLIAYFSLPEAEIFSEGWKESNVVVEISSAATDMWDDLNAFQNRRMNDDQNQEPEWAQQDNGDASQFQFGNDNLQQSFAKEFKKSVAEELANTTYSIMQAVDGVDRSNYVVDDEEFLENVFTESFFANLQN